jgi:hypothetical protein
MAAPIRTARRSHHRTARSAPRVAEANRSTLGDRTDSTQWRGSLTPCVAWPISILLFLTSLVFVARADAQTRLTVEWQAGRLSVSAERAPLAQVLQEVAHRTGIEVQGLDGLQESVSVRFSDLPLSEGLEKLLAQINYAILERPSPQGGTQPDLVVISTRRAPPTGEGNAPEGGAASEGAGSDTQQIVSEDEAPTEMTVTEIEDTAPEGEAASGQNPEERAAALHALAREGNEEALRKAILDPDPFIQATLFQVIAGKERQRVLTLLAEAAKSAQSTTRLQALQLLDQSRKEDEAATLARFREALADEVMNVKEQAIRVVAAQGGADAPDALRQTFHAADRPLKVMILESAAQQEEGLALLREATEDTDEVVRTFAAFWLKQAAPEGR